ncbi:TetR/AcrR family transcriptional regulator [Fodinicola feengrottensis]|uniref:TetR/AcrR family transcriptional regulator n=1 Tax=Fodinicola feengrottensis TaxID=435914 RepID=A0ABN2IWV0_9ACTN
MNSYDAPADDELTARILDAALAELRDYGLKRTSVENVARRAGLARATIYRRFANKPELVRVVAVREVSRMMEHVTRRVASLPTVQERVVEGFVAGVRLARDDSLLTKLLASEPETTLPYLTVDSEGALAAIRLLLVAQLMDTPEPLGLADPEATAEVMVRLGLSVLFAPRGHIPLDTEEDLRAFATTFLLPLLR